MSYSKNMTNHIHSKISTQIQDDKHDCRILERGTNDKFSAARQAVISKASARSQVSDVIQKDKN